MLEFNIILFLLTMFQEVDAREIIRKADQKMRGESSFIEMSMTIERPEWEREIQMKSWSLGTRKSLILITGPARDKGIAYLKREKEIWNWQPRIDRVIKLPPSMMMQSWMGSDFTNDDLVRESSILEDYTHHYVKDTMIRGYDAYKIELRPKEEAAVVWGKVHTYIDKKDYIQLMIKYFDEDGFLINTMHMYDIKQLDDRSIPTRLEMIPADKENQKTIVHYNYADFNIDIEENFFSLQNMKRVR